MSFDLESYRNNWKQHKINDAQMALAFFLFYHEKKYKNMKLKRALLSDESHESIFKRFVFKKVRSKATTALEKWLSGDWNFYLSEKILTPYEVLEYQAKGIRPVTMKIQSEMKEVLHKEDCLEFLIHDLEHGYMMFFDDEMKEMQVQFFNNIIKSFKMNLWQPYLGDERFEYRLNYLISDMNTHKEHYRSYLNAMISPEDVPKFEFIFS